MKSTEEQRSKADLFVACASGSASTRDDEPRICVELFTDGACIGNPGPGGWAFILKHPAKTKEDSGGEPVTTNNRMEIIAVIRGLEALRSPCKVELHSDSEYVVNGISNWMRKWKGFGWRRTVNAREEVKNADLWRRLDDLMQGHRVTAHWVRGHAGHPENERCDVLAEAAAAKIAQALRTSG